MKPTKEQNRIRLLLCLSFFFFAASILSLFLFQEIITLCFFFLHAASLFAVFFLLSSMLGKLPEQDTDSVPDAYSGAFSETLVSNLTKKLAKRDEEIERLKKLISDSAK